MRCVPCDVHRRLSAELSRRIQSVATSAELCSFGGDQRELHAAIAACADCKKFEDKGGN